MSKPKKIFWLTSLAKLLLKTLNYIYCLRVMLESTFKLVLHCLWSLFDILYTLYPVSQLEWPIIMTKQLLIICEWCSHRLFRSIRLWSWLENLKRVFSVIWLSWLWSCQVVSLAVWSCRGSRKLKLSLNLCPLAVWSCRGSRKLKLSLNLWQKPELSLNLLWKPELSL